MNNILVGFQKAYLRGSGPELAETLSPVASRIPQTRQELEYRPWIGNNEIRQRLSEFVALHTPFTKSESTAWADVYSAYWNALTEILRSENSQEGSAVNVYEAWKEVALALIKGYSSNAFAAWTVPCLYMVGRYVRAFAQHADEAAPKGQSTGFDASMKDDITSDANRNMKLEDAARVINRAFTICISDRAPIENSRKWGLYYITNLLFKTYFKLNSISLSKNIIRALQAGSNDMPPIDAFPKSHIVTFKYYVGVICFLEENYEMAEEHLSHAWKNCHHNAIRNKELILTYLIPCRLLTSHTLPSIKLLATYPRLQSLFGLLCSCVKKGDLAGFDDALIAGEEEFVKRRVYLTLERGRDIALRNLLRKVFIAGGFEAAKDGAPLVRRSRVPVAEFAAAIQLGTRTEQGQMDDEDVQCILANLIYKNLMKGYISRERGIVVLSKGSAFPGTGV